MGCATSLAEESDDLANVRSGFIRPFSELRQSERLRREFTLGERLSGSRRLVSLGFRTARARPQRARSAVAVAKLPPG